MSHATSYRPDVDGLRAIAILSVVVYHTHEALLPGGFIGVDIFFCHFWLSDHQDRRR